MKNRKRIYRILLLMVYLLVSGCEQQNQSQGQRQREKKGNVKEVVVKDNLTSEERAMKREYEHIMSEEFKPQISEILKERILKEYKEKFPGEEFYYLAEPRLMTEKNLYKLDFQIYEESQYVAYIATPKMNGGVPYSVIGVYPKSEDDMDIDTSEFEEKKDMIDIHGKVGNILEEVFGHKGRFTFLFNGGITSKHHRWIMTGENTFRRREKPRAEYLADALSIALYISFIVDDIEKVNEQEIGDKLIIFSERMKQEAKMAGNINLRIMDKANYLPKDKLYRWIGATMLATPKVKEIVNNWDKPITKDLDYLAQYLPITDGRQYRFMYSNYRLDSMEEGVSGWYQDFRQITKDTNNGDGIVWDIKWERKE